MNDQDDDRDPELRQWLRRWESPAAPPGIGERLRRSFRARVPGPLLWAGLLRARINVPVPLAALLLAIALGIGVFAGERVGRSRPDRGDAERAPAATSGGLANLRPLPEVRVTVQRAGGSDDRR